MVLNLAILLWIVVELNSGTCEVVLSNNFEARTKLLHTFESIPSVLLESLKAGWVFYFVIYSFFKKPTRKMWSSKTMLHEIH